MGRGLGDHGMAATSPRWIATLPLPHSCPLPRRPLVRPRLRLGAWDRPPGAGLCDPGPQAHPPLALFLREGESRPGGSCRVGLILSFPVLPTPGRKARPKACLVSPFCCRGSWGRAGHMEEQALFNTGFRGRQEPSCTAEQDKKGPEIHVGISSVVHHTNF